MKFPPILGNYKKLSGKEKDELKLYFFVAGIILVMLFAMIIG